MAEAAWFGVAARPMAPPAPEHPGEISRAAEKRDPRHDDAPCGADAATAAQRRRVYNREYMRAWRERHLERYRAKNREYQRRTAQRRKLRRLAQAAAGEPPTCWFRCGRPATQSVPRVDPRTWRIDSVPYCGVC